MTSIGIRKQARGTFDEVLARLPEALKAEGFGVLTHIDVQQTLREKLGVAFRRYRILGACNPRYALRALTAEPAVGALLPCSVALWEGDGGDVTVTAVDPMQTIAAADPALAAVAGEVRAALARALDAL
jgi:uncharacterized protein (DUF302 family)